MDRNSILGIILIGVIFIGWMIYSSIKTPTPPPEQQKSKADTALVKKDTTATARDSVAKETRESVVEREIETDTTLTQSQKDSLLTNDTYGMFFSQFAHGEEDTITVENDLLIAKITSRGGSIVDWQLKKYNKWDGVPVELIKKKAGPEFFLEFDSRDNKVIDTRDLYFDLKANGKDHYTLKGNDSLTISAKLVFAPGKEVVRTYTFYGNKYLFRTNVHFENIEKYIRLNGYFLKWVDGLKYQEYRSDLESAESWGMVVKNDEVVEVDATKIGEKAELETPIIGNIDYAAIKSKYFAAAFIPDSKNTDNVNVEITGTRAAAPNNGVVESYNMSIKMPYKGGVTDNTYSVYIGPLEYDIVVQYGLQKTINFGWWLLRPIGEHVLLPFFKFLHRFIPNYGVTIIIFSLFIKLLLYPLSITQMRSARKMQLIAPEMTKIREKYKDDPKKQQQEQMKLYSEYGVNPAGGCLPLLLQMPILIALWKVFNTAIDLRQAHFWLWIQDLSLPDYIVHLPFSLFGITDLSGLALLMGVTMFIQQKLTLTDPRQKAMIYLMPVMFTLMFSNLPSGLNLYYFMFNLFGIVQQVYINKFSKKQMTLEEMRKGPKKEGWLQRKMREAQEVAESQGRSAPGSAYSTNKTKYQRKKTHKGGKKK